MLRYATGGDGKVDWASVKSATKGFGVDVGGCVLASVVARALAPKSADPNAPAASSLEANPDDLRAGFEELRKSLGGKSFKTSTGTL